MFTTKIRATIVTLAAAFSFAGASLAPAVAQAKPVFKSPRAGMKGCTIKLGSNVTLAVDDEGYIEVTGASGKLITLRCKDGKWYEELQGPSTSVVSPLVTSPELLLSAPEVVSSSPALFTRAPLSASARA